jgi:cytochrome b subunit of formate dehydrogenase
MEGISDVTDYNYSEQMKAVFWLVVTIITTNQKTGLISVSAMYIEIRGMPSLPI